MTRASHFDVDAMRRQFQAGDDASFAASYSRAKTDEDRLYVRAQHLLAPAATEALVLMATADNEGIPKDMIVKAAGILLGRIAGSLAATFDDDPSVTISLMDAFADTLNTCLSGRAPAGTSMTQSEFAATQGGHA